MIKKIFTVTILCLSFNISFCQNYTKVDSISKKITNEFKTVKEISDFLTSNLDSDIEKLRSLYVWTAHNIEYDNKLINNVYYSKNEIIESALSTRKGVCIHYAELFNALCNETGLESYSIYGYVRHPDGSIPELAHAWNGVIIDSNYYFIDVTWASGFSYEDKYYHKFTDSYFLVEPQKFIKTHMPFDPIWQFLENPLNNIEFTESDFSKLETKGNFIFKDSINNLRYLDKLSQLEYENNRLIKSVITNDLIRKEVKTNNQNIIVLKFNKAVDTLNYGVDNYNTYINYKNKRFRNPKIDDNEIKELMNNTEKAYYYADKTLKLLFSEDNELNDLIINTKNKIPSYIRNLEIEQEFSNKYLKTWKPLRGLLFYSF